jgi:hypothetical protein
MKRMRWRIFFPFFRVGWRGAGGGGRRRGKGLSEASEGDVTLLPPLLFGFLCKVTGVNPFHYAVNVAPK